MQFKQWLEGKIAEFGFEDQKVIQDIDNRPEKENPIDTFNLELLSALLEERNIGALRPYSKFVNEVVWGNNQPGSMRMWIGTNYGVFLDRLGEDLLGQPKWYTKKYLQINRHGYGGYEEVVANELYDKIEELHKEQLDSPKGEYPELLQLAVDIAERCKRVARPIFIFDQIRKMNENRYIISFNLRGQGVQAPEQQRMEKLILDLNFYPREGVLRLINTSYNSPLAQHKFEITQSHADFCFFPTQPREEIVEAIATVLKYY